MEKRFNYVDMSSIIPQNINNSQEQQYEEWHDLIDIRTPKFNDANILHCPRVPKPLWGVNPRTILTQIDKGWWDRTRQRIYAANNYHCQCCGVHKTEQKGFPKNLDAHEYYDINYQTGEVRLKMIVCLCKYCHAFIHFGRLTELYNRGDIQEREFFATVSHGNTILKKAGLPMKNLDHTVNDNIYQIPWNQWRLILTIDGVEKSFYSLYKSEEDLKEQYFKKGM